MQPESKDQEIVADLERKDVSSHDAEAVKGGALTDPVGAPPPVLKRVDPRGIVPCI